MDLFVINRYVGDDAESENVPDESRLRRELIEKVKQRRSREEKEHVRERKESDSNYASKRKISNGDLTESDRKKKWKVESCDLGDSESVKKKKKKKKSKKDEDEEEGEQDSSNSVCIPEKSSVDKESGGDVKNGGDKIPDKKLFPILGADSFSKPSKVRHAIPHWLANPSIVSVDLKNLDVPVDSVSGLEEIFIKKLKENGISHFFPVQAQIIPWLLDDMKKPNFYWPRDICVSAPTGSGKTLAFVLPILQALRNRIVPRIRAVVVLPVQDLAVQVYKVFETYSEPTPLKVLLLSSKQSFDEEQNLIRKEVGPNTFTTAVDIIVTTAGRLVDHLMNTNGFDLKHLRYLIIDEADRIMEDTQIDWLYHLNKNILSDSSKAYQTPVLSINTLLTKRRPPQKLLFSATLSQDPEKLQQLGLFQPKLFTSIVSGNHEAEANPVGRFVGKYTTPAELQEYYALCEKATKPLIVHHLLSSERWKSVLCFVNSVEATRRLSFVLKKMNSRLVIRNMSAQLDPDERSRLIRDFSTGRIHVLISSDALARGIDLPNVKYVISYDLPKYLKTYIHRIGRTGRAGKTGTSLVLLIDKEVNRFQGMIADAGKKSVKEMVIQKDRLNDCSEEYKKALAKLDSHLQKERKAFLRIVKTMKNSKIKKHPKK